MRRHSRASAKPAKSRRSKSSKSKSRNLAKVATRRPSRSGSENEVVQLRRELHEAREQQTATANVLHVIAGSPTDIEPVLEVIVQTAGELCGSEYAILWRLWEGKYHMAWSNNADPQWAEYWAEHPITPDRGSLLGRTVLERRAVHIADCLNDPEYTQHEASRTHRPSASLAHCRSNDQS